MHRLVVPRSHDQRRHGRGDVHAVPERVAIHGDGAIAAIACDPIQRFSKLETGRLAHQLLTLS